ncbi:MAG: hypothetical protein OHK0053_13080 [Microscillaceae bacterium]
MRKVLIVDDEPNILLSLEFLMKKQGYIVFIARDGREALDIIQAQNPEVIILDIMMPEMDGYEVCQFVKNHPLHHESKVVFLSAKTKDTEIAQGYAAGADLYITKPFSTRHLTKQVGAFFEEVGK